MLFLEFYIPEPDVPNCILLSRMESNQSFLYPFYGPGLIFKSSPSVPITGLTELQPSGITCPSVQVLLKAVECVVTQGLCQQIPPPTDFTAPCLFSMLIGFVWRRTWGEFFSMARPLKMVNFKVQECFIIPAYPTPHNQAFPMGGNSKIQTLTSLTF